MVVWEGEEKKMEETTTGFYETEQLYVPERQPRLGPCGDRGNPHTGRLPKADRKYEIKKLWEQHHKMLRLTLLGWAPQDIATELGVSKVTVTSCLNSSLGRKLLAEMQAVVDNKTIDVATRLQTMSLKAAETLENMLDDEATAPSLRARIAMDNLDRTGHARQINVKGQFTHGVLTAADIEKLKEAAYSEPVSSLADAMPQKDTQQKTISRSYEEGNCDSGRPGQKDTKETTTVIEADFEEVENG